MSEIAIAMPQVFSTSPCNNTKQDVSFTIINQDKLPLNMTISGERIVKPFDNTAQKMKPNVIVHPTRRLPVNSETHKELDGIVPEAQQRVSEIEVSGRNRRNKFRNRHNSRVKMKIEEFKNQIGSNFNKVLDFKLKKIQKTSKQVQQDISKKPFVTTVKKGLFLEPPPEIASLIGIKVEEPILKKDPKEINKLYAFASHPRVLNRLSPKNLHYARCEAAAKAAGTIAQSVIVPKGTRDEDSNENQESFQTTLGRSKFKYNNNYHLSPPADQPKWNPHFAYAKLLSRDTGNRGSASARAREAHRRALARKRAKNQQSNTSISSQDERIRERRNVYDERVQEMGIQTDQTIPVPTLRGEDIGTQINPGDLFNFDEAVQPILEILVGKTIEQALIEVLEEEELVALGEQQRRYLENRAVESLAIDSEDVIFNKINDQRSEEKVVKAQTYGDNNIPPAIRIQETVSHLLPVILEHLEDKGFSLENYKKDFDVSFLPWLLKEIMLEIQDMISSRDVLSDIVKEILENRAEIERVINKKSSEDTDEDLEFIPKRDIHIET